MRIRPILRFIAPLLVFGVAGCELAQEEPAEAPEVEPGEMPQYEVQPGQVEVERDTITVPEVEVQPPDQQQPARPQR